MANPLPHIRLEDQQLAAASMEMPREKSDSPMDLPSAERRYTFGILAPLSSSQLERTDFGRRSLLSPEPEDESGKHTICSTGLKNGFCMQAPFS